MILRYFSVWVLLAVVAVANGTIRQFTYGRIVAELTAHQISTVTAILFSGLVVWAANRLWPIQSVSQAWKIGLSWLIMTLCFEFGFGHYVAGHSWARLLADYDLLDGRIWPLFLLWITILPALISRCASKHQVSRQ
jgi:hypothetical protein